MNRAPFRSLSGLTFFTGVLFLTSSTPAATLRVPADYPTIQQAIDHALSGDTVLVSPGVYVENISFKGKAITVSGTNPSDWDVIQTTVINAHGHTSAVSFTNGETRASVLTGLTLTGGVGTVNQAIDSTIYWGGGVYCYGSSPTIAGNLLTGNITPDGTLTNAGYGAGIGCLSASPLITRNIFKSNSGYAGGGILTYLGNPVISDNLVYSNSALIGGGAVLVYGGTLVNNTLSANTAEFIGNVYSVSDPSTGQSAIVNNIICNAANGGGIYLAAQQDIDNTRYNDVWNNNGGNYTNTADQTGLNGNLSQDPRFVDADGSDFHLQDTSPCINAGDLGSQSLAGVLDIFGNSRIFAKRIDIGAAEYWDNFRPIADAGPAQDLHVTAPGSVITLDGSASTDPNGLSLSYSWTQASGPVVQLSSANAAKPSFTVSQVGAYEFSLVVNNGQYSSFPDTVKIVVRNDPPVANAGPDQSYSVVPASIILDGTRSTDPENAPLTYRWRQLSGWKVQLSDTNLATPSFAHPWPGIYAFELVVNDGMQDSQPAVVGIVMGNNHAPIAVAGPTRYLVSGSVTLDGTGSYDPDGYAALSYRWRQVSGVTVTMAGTNTATPTLSGIRAYSVIQRYVFELVVSDGDLTSAPSQVTVTTVPNYGTNALVLYNASFDPTKPTIVAFGGGNCSTGSGLAFGSTWYDKANWLTVNSYGPSYSKYGDMLMVYLTSNAPAYTQPIQTVGFSTGNLPAMEVARYVNVTYKDPRYAVNRVSLLDPVCSNLSGSASQFNANPVAREQCWIDNYISNDPNYRHADYMSGVLDVMCNPYRSHSYPPQRYASSSLSYTNGGLVAFGYLSVVGDGKNYQLNTAASKYYFVINSTEALTFYNQSLYPGKILAPVTLSGPPDGATLDSDGAVLSCGSTQNAVRYQVLLGSDPHRVMDFTVASDTTNAPSLLLTNLPYQRTWWTVKAFDQFGSYIYADPLLLQRPETKPPVANAGSNQVVYADLSGVAAVTLDGRASQAPQGAVLTYTWAWLVNGVPFETNGAQPTIELPVGAHTIQLRVDDGISISEPGEVTVTVIGPIQGTLVIVPNTINRKSHQPHIMAKLRLPQAISKTELDFNAPVVLCSASVVLWPAQDGVPASRQWGIWERRLPFPGKGGVLNSVSGRQEYRDCNQRFNVLLAFFDKTSVMDAVPINGDVKLRVVGQLKSGQWFYGDDTVTILGGKRNERDDGREKDKGLKSASGNTASGKVVGLESRL